MTDDKRLEEIRKAETVDTSEEYQNKNVLELLSVIDRQAKQIDQLKRDYRGLERDLDGGAY